jgi:nicotinamide-nucleotide amidase
MKCQLLMTGNELMTGVTVDTNAAWLAEQLTAIGIRVHRKTTIGDNMDELVQAITHATMDSGLLIINGGLGPTSDDLTAEALSRVSGAPLKSFEDAESHIIQWCEARGMKANNANLKQALRPESAEMVHNPSGSAPGISMTINDCLVLCTPGVPSEMKLMYEQSIKPTLLAGFNESRQQVIRRLQLFGIGESSIQQKIHHEQ